MIILNGSKFAKNETEFTNSLFEAGGTCVGYYKRNKCSVTLSDHNKNKIGVINKYKVLCKATKQESSGKYWYSYGDIDLIGAYSSYSEQVLEVAQALRGRE